jgi:ParB family chromosome partitioning protein
MKMEDKLKSLNNKLVNSDLKAIGKITAIKLDKINKNNFNFYEMSEIEDLSNSIKFNKQIVPIIVRRIKEEEHDLYPNKEYLIIDGQRRFEACLLLEFEEINAIVIDIDDIDLEYLMLIEANNQRIKNHIEKAKEYKIRRELYDKLGFDGIREVIAENDKISKSQQTRFNKILELNEENQELINNGKLTLKDIDLLKNNTSISLNDQVTSIVKKKKAKNKNKTIKKNIVEKEQILEVSELADYIYEDVNRIIKRYSDMLSYTNEEIYQLIDILKGYL